MAQKIKYELDPYNRLVANLPKFRKVLDGRFKLGADNELSYHVKAPIADADGIPNQLRLSGAWSLTGDHRLRITLDKSARETFGDRMDLEGEILDVNKNSLLFAVTTVAKDGASSTYVLNIAGVWKADEHNRLSFHVRRERGNCDILTFTGVWELGANHQIIYRYEDARLMKSKSRTHELIFKGYWDIKDKARISYVLDKDTGSTFDFKTSVGIFKEDYIQYEAGMGLAGRRKQPVRTMKLYGKWNLKKDAGLIFEIEYDNGRVGTIVFGADARLTGRDTVSFRLKDNIADREMGASLELSRKIFKGAGEAFLKALVSARGTAVYVGASGEW